MIFKMWRQEFKVEKFRLNHPTPEDFWRCHWQKSEKAKPLWVVYRGLMALYFVLSLIYTILPIERSTIEAKYPIFLTHWTYCLETLTFVLSFVIACRGRAYSQSANPIPPEPMKTMPFLFKFYWAVFTIVLPSAITVSVMFWVVIYDAELFPANPSSLINHAFNSVFIVIDFFLVAHPYKFLHFYWPVTFGFVYAVFTLIYQLSGGTGVKGMIPIYNIMDWRKPGYALLTCFFCFVFLLIVHFLFCLLHMLKVCLKRRKTSKEDANTDANTDADADADAVADADADAVADAVPDADADVDVDVDVDANANANAKANANADP